MNEGRPTINTASVRELPVLREQDQFRILANAVPQLVWMAGSNGSIHWYNQRWYDFTGTTLEETSVDYMTALLLRLQNR